MIQYFSFHILNPCRSFLVAIDTYVQVCGVCVFCIRSIDALFDILIKCLQDIKVQKIKRGFLKELNEKS
jgi:hypothetical protein